MKQDVIPLLNGDCEFYTDDGIMHKIKGEWDMIIAFPPCTYLTNAGTRHFSLKCNDFEKVQKRLKKRQEAAEFFKTIYNSKCGKIAIENPVGYMNKNFLKPTQIIHPYYFASSENDVENYVQKRTCLWLKGLKPLTVTNFLQKPKPKYYCNGEKCKGKAIGWCEGMSGIKGGQQERSKARSKTFPAIALAMAEQWG